MLKITSLQNQRVKEVVKLRDRRERDRSQLFLIEGYREIKRAVDAGRKIATLYICPEFFLGENEEELIRKAALETVCCTKEVFQKLSYRDRPDGLLAVAPIQHKTLGDLEKILEGVKEPFILVAESIEKPGNLGTILRSSDAAGVDAVIVSDPTTDIHNPNVVRSSVGTLFTVPVIEAASVETLAFLRKKKVKIVAATPSASQFFTEADLRGAVAILVGTEQLGLSPLWMEAADTSVKIPMLGTADSLNVATATTLLLYEVVRQRALFP